MVHLFRRGAVCVLIAGLAASAAADVDLKPDASDGVRAQAKACGATLRVAPTPKAAAAYIEDGERIIQVSPDIAKREEPMFEFVIAHECAHHELGHTEITIDISPTQREAFERMADCAAAEKLAADRNYEPALDYLKMMASQSGFHYMGGRIRLKGRALALSNCLVEMNDQSARTDGGVAALSR